MTLKAQRLYAITFLHSRKVAEIDGQHDRRRVGLVLATVVRRTFFACGCAIIRPGRRAARRRVGTANSRTVICETHRRALGSGEKL